VSETGHRFNFRERLELWSALLMAAATVATAFSAYESTRWSGEQSTQFTQAGASRTESAKANTEAAAQITIDASLFTEVAVAFSQGNKQGQEIVEGFFRKEFKPSYEEWIAMRPLKNPDAPATPFSLDSYRLAKQKESERLEAEATAHFDAGREANQNGDNYVLATIFFAAVLFFAGVATKFTSDRVVAFTLGVGTVVFLSGFVRLLTLPFH
jgi:hypothetical protein